MCNIVNKVITLPTGQKCLGEFEQYRIQILISPALKNMISTEK